MSLRCATPHPSTPSLIRFVPSTCARPSGGENDTADTLKWVSGKFVKVRREWEFRESGGPWRWNEGRGDIRRDAELDGGARRGIR